MPVRELLDQLGVCARSEWDVLTFLHRHETSLTSAAQIAELLGHSSAAVSAALDRLITLELIQRSRGSRGIRLYRISVSPDSSRYSCFVELMKMAESREGRILLLQHLPPGPLQPLVRTRGLRVV